MERRESAPPACPISSAGRPHVRTLRWNVRAKKKVPLSFGATGSGRLVYAKPFVSAPKAIVGGLRGYSVSIPTEGQYRSR